MQKTLNLVEVHSLGGLWATGRRDFVSGMPGYVAAVDWLGDADLMSCDCSELLDLFDAVEHSPLRGFILALLHFRAEASLFGSAKYFRTDLAAQEAYALVGREAVFCVEFELALERVNPMSGGEQQMRWLAQSAACPLSCGYVLGVIAARAQLGMIRPEFGEGRAMNQVLFDVMDDFKCVVAQTMPCTLTSRAAWVC